MDALGRTRFEVFRRSDNVGFGLRTLSNIPHGCAVMEFCGEVIDQKVLVARGAEALDYAFCLQTANETELFEKLTAVKDSELGACSEWNIITYIDPKKKGNIGRFISHGCFPNLIMLRYAENDLRLHRSRAILFASQPILGGSELFFDYGNQYLSRAGFKCECGTLWCKSVKKRFRSTRLSNEEVYFIEKRLVIEIS
ncbi:SET domain protein [Dictyocaulus viviparus]|uniref:SET domain protein n=1 Tax=Dictyocaulus viviparus TaxID=29172 RepID=A0A0D8XNT5_DICVI|nr:SET domain protein [Dictyocaulus viviparus]